MWYRKLRENNMGRKTQRKASTRKIKMGLTPDMTEEIHYGILKNPPVDIYTRDKPAYAPNHAILRRKTSKIDALERRSITRALKNGPGNWKHEQNI